MFRILLIITLILLAFPLYSFTKEYLSERFKDAKTTVKENVKDAKKSATEFLHPDKDHDK